MSVKDKDYTISGPKIAGVPARDLPGFIAWRFGGLILAVIITLILAGAAGVFG